MIDTLAILFTSLAIGFVIVRSVTIDAIEPWFTVPHARAPSGESRGTSREHLDPEHAESIGEH